MQLRPHQEKAIDMLRQSLSKGYKRPVLAACCSFGKTITALYILTEAAKKGKKGILFCDRIKLVQQALAAFDREGVEVGVIQSMHERTNRQAMIQIASIQSVARMQRKPEFDLAIVDECFIGSTLVDGKRIDSLKVGDFVMSYNHKTNKIEKKKVLRVMKKKSKDISAINIDSNSAYCTPSHKFWNGRNYEEIRNIKSDIYRIEDTSIGLRETFKEMVLSVRDLPRMVCSFFQHNWAVQQWESVPCLSQSRVQGSQKNNKQSKFIEKNEELFKKWRLRKDDYRQSIKKARSKKQDIQNTKSNGTQTDNARWEWKRVDQAAKNTARVSRLWLGVRVYTKNWWRTLSKPLQNRFSEQEKNDSYRGRWWITLFTRKAVTRQEKNRVIRKTRLESYQVLEQRDIKKLGLLQDESGQYDVWDIEVEDNHNFFANGYLVHNCHVHYKTTQKLMERYSNVPFIGLSATPYSRGMGKYYNDLIVPITPLELVDMGYLTPVDYYGGAKIDTKGIKRVRTAGGMYDYDQKELSRRTEEEKDRLSGDIVKNWFKHAEGMQTIAFSPSIKHSKYLVELFNSHGVSAYHIDGYMKDDMRQELFDAHDNGEFQILSCSQLLSTGYDSPTTSCIIDCKPTNLTNYVQIAGRIMRTAEGKDRAVYLDHAGNCRKWGFAEAVVPDELDDGEKKYNEKSLTKEKKEAKVKPCPVCGAEMMGLRCKCGYEIPITEQLQTDGEELVKIKRDANKVVSTEQKAKFFSELILHGKHKGYKKGWAANKYKERFGVFPNRIQPYQAYYVSDETKSYLKHLNIKYAKRKVS